MANFQQSDRILAQLDQVVANEQDDYIKSQYTGFVAVCAVTAFETNVREKLIEFCTKKHKVFGHYSESIFDKMNARVKLDHLRDDYLARFGTRYLNKFKKKLKAEDEASIAGQQGSVKSAYSNLVVWRHAFVHDGVLPQNATYQEARAAYELSKKVIDVFCDSLSR